MKRRKNTVLATKRFAVFYYRLSCFGHINNDTQTHMQTNVFVTYDKVFFLFSP